MKYAVVAAAIAFALPVQAVASMEVSDILETYADIALAKYEDSHTTALELQSAVRAFLTEPSEASLKATKTAWISARVPYQQTEVYRFGNVLVDEWEGKVNAWPLDEGLIDYVHRGYGANNEENAFYTANVIANPDLVFGGHTVDATTIDQDLIHALHEVDAVEANVASGYHAIEFLIWGQDLNGTGPGAGERPWTDYSLTACTGGNCGRRAAYLTTATDLLVADLREMVVAWGTGGKARVGLSASTMQDGLATIITGMGSLSFGELAGERIKLGLLLHDPEEEHDCFSDNTHNSHYFDEVGIQNVYLGRYQRIDGRVVEGPALSDLVKATAPEVDVEMRGKLDATIAAMEAMRQSAENGVAYDQLIADGNTAGNAVVQAAVDALLDQTTAIKKVVATLALGDVAFEGSDSLENPEAVFQ